jgi:hypothetical protein
MKLTRGGLLSECCGRDEQNYRERGLIVRCPFLFLVERCHGAVWRVQSAVGEN